MKFKYRVEFKDKTAIIIDTDTCAQKCQLIPGWEFGPCIVSMEDEELELNDELEIIAGGNSHRRCGYVHISADIIATFSKEE